jgi:hypothetical protein
MKKENTIYTPPQHTGTGSEILVIMALILVIISPAFLMRFFKEEHKDIRPLPQLVEHKVRLIRPDGSIEKELTVKNYDNSVRITTDNGNLCVADFSRNSYMFFAPTGWYLEPVDSKEE